MKSGTQKPVPLINLYLPLLGGTIGANLHLGCLCCRGEAQTNLVQMKFATRCALDLLSIKLSPCPTLELPG